MATLLGAVGLAACVSTPAPGADALADMMSGTFQTDPARESQVRDRRVPIAPLSEQGRWFYYQVNSGADDAVYRQRIMQLVPGADGRIIQQTYGLKTPEEYIDAWKTPGLLDGLSMADIEPYFESGCEQVWQMQAGGIWSGYVDPKTCVIFSERRQKDIRIEAEALVDGDTYRMTERGYDIDMQQIWGSEPGEYLVLYRQ